jgi:hypothetical protein
LGAAAGSTLYDCVADAPKAQMFNESSKMKLAKTGAKVGKLVF